MNPAGPPVIFFDLGGTLLYFDGNWSQVLARANQALVDALLAIGLELDRQAFLEDFSQRLSAYHTQRELDFIEHTTSLLLREALAAWGFKDVAPAAQRQALDAMYAVSQAHWQPEADAYSALQDLQGRGYRMGVISNAGDEVDVQALVDKAQLRPFFEMILTSAACGIRKPVPRIYQLALEQMQTGPQATYMVGDSLGPDVMGAQDLGLTGIWITRRANNAANRAQAGTIIPDHSIETLAQLPPLMAEIG